MKLEELMLNDWVLYNENLCKVARISERLFLEKDEKVFYAPIEKITPLPLTAEILEKNGFELIKDCTSAWEWKKEYYSVQVSGNPATFLPQTLTIYTPVTNMTYGAGYQRTLSDLPINGVHELQHALRLCGIDIAINL